MARTSRPATPPEPPGGTPMDVIDPRSGERVPATDMREEFARISRKVPRDRAAERAFIEGKIAMILGDSRLSREEKAKAVAALRGR